MNCSNCNTPLTPGNNVCPNCGALNMAFSAPINDQTNIEMPQQSQMPQLANEVVSQDNLEPLLDDSFESLDDNGAEDGIIEEDNIEITATMAPPELQVGNENLTSGVTDISNANISTYSPEAIEEEKEEEKERQDLENNRVDFQIPSVEKPVEDASIVYDETGVPIMDGGNIVEIPQEENKTNSEENEKIKVGKLEVNLPFKKGKNVPMLFFIIVVVCALIFGVVIGKMFFSKSVYVKGSYNSNGTKTEIKRVSDGKNNVTKAGAYTFKIPEGYYYDTNNGGVSIYDADDTFRIFMRADSGLYNDVASARVSIVKTLEENKVTVKNYKEVEIEKKAFVVIETTTKMNNRLIAYTDAKNDYVFFIEVVTNSNNFNYDALDIAADIANNATYNEKESEMETIEINDISEVVLKATQEYKNINN